MVEGQRILETRPYVGRNRLPNLRKQIVQILKLDAKFWTTLAAIVASGAGIYSQWISPELALGLVSTLAFVLSGVRLTKEEKDAVK